MKQEEKAKAYDEALERASKLRVQNPFDTVSQMMEHVFPELKESEDERIRKELLSFVRGMLACHDKPNAERDEKYESWIAWLEKQGEQKLFAKYKVGDTIYYDSFGRLVSFVIANIVEDGTDNPMYEDKDGNSVFQNDIVKQKPADRIKPKFNIGDTMRTLQEANDGYTDGMPVVVSIDNEYYHCTNELIAIKDQDDYEFPPINAKQKPTDKVEPKFKVWDKIYLKPEYRMPDDDTPIANTVFEIRAIDDKHYKFDGSYIFIEDQDKYELVEQKPAEWSEEEEKQRGGSSVCASAMSISRSRLSVR